MTLKKPCIKETLKVDEARDGSHQVTNGYNYEAQVGVKCLNCGQLYVKSDWRGYEKIKIFVGRGLLRSVWPQKEADG